MKEKELNTEEMDQVSGGRTFIVYDKTETKFAV